MITCLNCGNLNRASAKFCARCGSHLRPSGTEQILGGKYRVIRPLSRGGMGASYLAETLDLPNRYVAIQELFMDSLATPDEYRQSLEHFKSEANLLARLDHPAIPKISDLFAEQHQHYLVMEYVEGEYLDSIRDRRGRLPEERVLEIADQICDALEYLHSQNPPIIHRDITPNNIKISRYGKAILVDFGLAKEYRPGQKTHWVARAITPGYSPIEQYGSGTDHRSDIYSLGATLYDLLTGQVPPEAPSRLSGADTLDPPRVFNAMISLQTGAVILKALELKPEDRFQSVRELRAALIQVRAVPIALPAPTAMAPVSKPQKSAERQINVPVYAVARAELEANDLAIVGRQYSIKAGIARETPTNFAGQHFDLLVRDPSQPVHFDIVVHTGANIELVSDWHKDLWYYPLNPEPQLVVFSLRVIQPGRNNIKVDFYHEHRWLRTIRLEFESVLSQSRVFSS